MINNEYQKDQEEQSLFVVVSANLLVRQLEDVEKIVKNDPIKFTSISHFIRVAVAHEIKKENEVKTE